MRRNNKKGPQVGRSESVQIYGLERRGVERNNTKGIRDMSAVKNNENGKKKLGGGGGRGGHKYFEGRGEKEPVRRV